MEKTMSDLIFWGLTAVFLAVLIWAFWPKLAGLLRITANEGDELMTNIENVRKQAKRKLKR
jgi:hypothetical protein